MITESAVAMDWSTVDAVVRPAAPMLKPRSAYPPAPEAFTVREYARAHGITKGTASNKLLSAYDDGHLERARTQGAGSPYVYWLKHPDTKTKP